MKIFDKIAEFYTSGKFTVGKAVGLGLSIMTPLFLIAAAPAIAWFSIAAEHRYDEKFYWLQDFMWIWPLCLVGVGFIGAIAWMIYNYVRDSK